MKKPFIPNGRKGKSTFQLKDFLGVDFSTHESEVDNRRSPDAVNMISGQAGSMDKRLGTKIMFPYSGKINSITKISYSYTSNDGEMWFNPSTQSSNWIPVVVNRYEEKLLLHIGTSIYMGYIDTNGNYVDEGQINFRLETGSTISTSAITIMDRPTTVIRINQFLYMIINGGACYFIDIVIGGTYDGWSGATFGYNASVSDMPINKLYPAYIIDTRYVADAQYKLKVPTTLIACSPTLSNKTIFESKNELSAYIKHTYLGNGSSTVYKLSESMNNFYAVTKDYCGYTIPWLKSGRSIFVELMDANGVWSSVGSYTVTDDNTITFTTAPPSPSVIGRDNIRITYLPFQAWANRSRILSRLTSFGYFGYNGKDDFAFASYGFDGDNGKLNKDYRIKLSDVVNEIYMDVDGYSNLGDSNSKILGYFRMNNELVTVTKKTSNNPTVFIRNATLDSDGITIFPIRVGVVGVGSVEGDTFASLRDDPLWVSEYGVNALITNNITNIQSVQDRGFYINNQLLNESSLNNSLAFVYNNKYFLCVNGHIYIADSRSKYSEKLAYSESYQYDWFYWEGINITAQAEINGDCYYGTPDGKLCRFKKPTDTKPYEDEIIGTETTWANATNYVVGQLVKDSGTPIKYYICLKAHTSLTDVRGLTNETYWNEITKGTDRFYVPVLAYWTTPILNMNNITAKKTLRNLWVRLPKYAFTGVRIYYSSKGLVKKQFDGIFDFSTLDFSRLTFSTDTDPMVVVTNTKQSKFMSIQFKIESRDNTPMSLLEIVGEYTTNGKFKG